MTVEDYRARVKAWGLTPCRPSVNRHTIHQTRDGSFIRVPDPEYLAEEEREPVLDLMCLQHGFRYSH